MGGGEWGAPGWPRVQVKETVARPLLVVRLREASPHIDHTVMNSLTDATTNCEFDLEDIFTMQRDSPERGLAGVRLTL